MMQFDKDMKITLEMDGARAAILLDTIMTSMEEVQKGHTVEAICKSIILHEIGQQIVDQFVPKDKQQAFMQNLMQDEAVLNVLKKEGRLP